VALSNPFEPIRDTLKRAASLEDNKLLFFIWGESLIQEEIIFLNTEVQLFQKQQRADGSELPPYSISTLQFKPSNFPENITLLDTGAFYGSFTVKPVSDGFLIEANTLKPGVDLAEQYGENIIGLQDESIEILAEFILPFIQERVLQILQGTQVTV